jgi:signal peptidase I
MKTVTENPNPSEALGHKQTHLRAAPRARHRFRHALASVIILVAGAGFAIFFTSNHAYIYTPSMYPTIPPGSMVFIQPQKHYHVGEVIEFRGNGLLWVHRLIQIKPNGDYVTKGDNPENRPDIFVPATTQRDVIGSVVLAVRYLGFPELIAEHPGYGLAWLRAELGFRGKLAVAILVESGCALYLLRRRKPVAGKGATGDNVPATGTLT